MLRILTAVGALVLGAVQGALPASAQEYPTEQPIKVVVAANAGGLTDSLARIIAEFLQRRMGQAVIVENRPGASGTIAADYVAKAPADGYTLFLAAAEQAIAPAVRDNLPYNFEDFTFLIQVFKAQPLILASPSFAPSSVQELLDYMKANPGRVRHGTTGVGAIVHMGSAMLEGSAGVKGVHIPYTGIAPVYTDLLAGNIDVTFGGTVPFLDGLKVLGSVGTKRSPIYPDLPTLEEVGVEGASWDVWFGFVAPPDLPQPIADRLIAEISAILEDPAAIEKIKGVTKSVPEANPLTGEDFKKQALDEVINWKSVAEREDIIVQQ